MSKDVGEGDVENEMGVDEIRMKGKEWSKGAFVTICYCLYIPGWTLKLSPLFIKRRVTRRFIPHGMII